MPSTNLSNKEPIKQEVSRSWWSWRKRNTSRETTPAPEQTPTSETKPIIIEDVVRTCAKFCVNSCVVAFFLFIDVETQSIDIPKLDDLDQSSKSGSSEKYKKSLRLSSQQIVSSFIISFERVKYVEYFLGKVEFKRRNE